MAYQMAAVVATLKVIHRLQAFSNAIRRTFVQHFTRFQPTVCSHGSSALAELLVSYRPTCYWRWALWSLRWPVELCLVGSGDVITP